MVVIEVNSRVAVDDSWVPSVVNPELSVVLWLSPVVLVIEAKYEVDLTFLASSGIGAMVDDSSAACAVIP